MTRSEDVMRNESGDRLVVCHASHGVVGKCSIVTPAAARARGGYFAERLFDLAPIDLLRERMVEVGAIHLHPDHRPEKVLSLLWSTLARYLIDNGCDYVLATAAIGLGDGGHAAASIYRKASAGFASPEDLCVRP